MKANKLLKTLAASTMSLALLAGVAVMPAMAAPVTGDGTVENKLTKISVSDVINTDGKTYAPNTELTISVTEGEGGTFADKEGSTATALAGVDGGLTGTTITFTTDEEAGPKTSYTQTGDLVVNDGVFETAGIYHYVVTQTEPENKIEGMTYSEETYDVYLYVMNTTDLSDLYVGYAVSVKRGETAQKADLVFTNNYDQGNTALHDLVLYKLVTGDAANMKDKFQFTVKIDGDAGEKYYVERGTYDNNTFTSNGTTMTLVSGESATIELGNKDALKVYSLDGTESYTIEEIGDNSNGYTLKINDVADNDGVTTGTISADATVKYENTKNASTPTGVILNVAPYALMVVIAVAGVAVFMRKRVED